MKLKYIGQTGCDSSDEYYLAAYKELTIEDIKKLIPHISTGCTDADEDMHDYTELELVKGKRVNIVILTTYG